MDSLRRLLTSLSPMQLASLGGVLLAVMGVVLGWARARTGGLLVPIALHATFNAASLIAGVILR